MIKDNDRKQVACKIIEALHDCGYKMNQIAFEVSGDFEGEFDIGLCIEPYKAD